MCEYTVKYEWMKIHNTTYSMRKRDNRLPDSTPCHAFPHHWQKASHESSSPVGLEYFPHKFSTLNIWWQLIEPLKAFRSIAFLLLARSCVSPLRNTRNFYDFCKAHRFMTIFNNNQNFGYMVFSIFNDQNTFCAFKQERKKWRWKANWEFKRDVISNEILLEIHENKKLHSFHYCPCQPNIITKEMTARDKNIAANFLFIIFRFIFIFLLTPLNPI